MQVTALNEICDVCGSSEVREIKCKLICQNCGTILRSCADLFEILQRFTHRAHPAHLVE